MIFWPKSEIQTFFPAGGLQKKQKKNKKSSPKLRVIFRPKFKRFFRPKAGGLQKKKVFTKIETDFSAEIVRFRLVGGMHPEMETDFSKWRLIFRPKSLVLGWWGGCIPPLNPPLVRMSLVSGFPASSRSRQNVLHWMIQAQLQNNPVIILDVIYHASEQIYCWC